MRKFKSILQFLWDNLKWNILRVIGWIIYPTIVYPFARRIWANGSQGFLWWFLNDGKQGSEHFIICTRKVAPDWYVMKHGFDYSHPPNKFEQWWIAVKWNAFRNPVDNYLNYVIGFSGWEMNKLIDPYLINITKT